LAQTSLLARSVTAIAMPGCSIAATVTDQSGVAPSASSTGAARRRAAE